MATLNIAGKRVKVDDAFLSMTPEQQQTAVDEIAAQISVGGTASPATEPTIKIGDRTIPRSEYMAMSNEERQRLRSDVAKANPSVDRVRAESSILDPFVQGTTFGWADEGRGVVQGAIAAAQGGDFGKVYDQTVRESRSALANERQMNPVGSAAAEIAGALPTAIAGGGTLGAGGNLLTRAITGGAIGAAQGGVYGAGAAEGDFWDRLEGARQSAIVGGATGVVLPPLAAAAGGAARAIGSKVQPLAGAILNPIGEASRRVGLAVLRDERANPSLIMNQADEAVAQQADIPLLNVDRGGETTRALARSVANQSPEARAVLQKTADDRFTGQGDRATQFIKRLAGGSVDDLAYQDGIRRAAKATNKPRYDAAYNAPRARAIWTPEIRQLMQAGPFRAAIEGAEATARNDAAVSGLKAVQNPFQFLPDGSVTLRQMPDGSRALPSLQFWDIVQRNLRATAEQASRSGNNLLASQVRDMRNQLLNVLDGAVPQFKVARQGAASFFDAEDALDAGRKFATQPKAVPEAKRAFSKFTEAEKRAFATGYASELIDRIKATRDRVNVINSLFGSQSSREMMETVFGKAKARELEAYVRVENLADMLRGSLGNSTTARQLVELGIGAGVGGIPGYLLSGGDWRGALAGAAAVRGSRFAVDRANARVMQDVAKLLTSNTPEALDRARANALLSEQWMDALKRLEISAAMLARGSALPAASGAGQN